MLFFISDCPNVFPARLIHHCDLPPLAIPVIWQEIATAALPPDPIPTHSPIPYRPPKKQKASPKSGLSASLFWWAVKDSNLRPTD